MSRIVAGTARGRRLHVPRGLGTRPTSEKVRGAVFNVLGQFFEGGDVLDLYAGSGALALEALSRGCARATLVERDRVALEAIRRNAEACGFSGRVEILPGEVRGRLARLPADRFDLVFVDPPYEEGPGEALALLDRVTRRGGRVVAEHAADAPPADRFGNLALAARRGWGGTGVSIYVRE